MEATKLLFGLVTSNFSTVMEKGCAILLLVSFTILSLGCSDDDPVVPKPVVPKMEPDFPPFQQSAFNPVFEVTDDGSWDDTFVYFPTVVKMNDTIRMWYIGGAIASRSAPAEIGYAWSLKGEDWTRYEGNPVISPEADDAPGFYAPHVLLDGDTLRMWYLGKYPSTSPIMRYATSTDGVNWSEHPEAIEFPAKDWYKGGLFPGPVIKENGFFKMWFDGGLGSFNPSGESTRYSIGYAESADGINWVPLDQPVIMHGQPGTFDERNASFPTVVKDNSGGYHMWYTGNETSGPDALMAYAISADGISWEKKGAVIFPSSLPWAGELISQSAILDANQFKVWYGGLPLAENIGPQIGYAWREVN